MTWLLLLNYWIFSIFIMEEKYIDLVDRINLNYIDYDIRGDNVFIDYWNQSVVINEIFIYN